MPNCRRLGGNPRRVVKSSPALSYTSVGKGHALGRGALEGQEGDGMASQRSMWRGTLTLTGAALAARGLGLVYRVLLARFLGAEGLGTFQLVLPVYLFLVTLSTAGMPVAVSQTVGEGRWSREAILSTSFRAVLTFTIPLTVAWLLLSRPLAAILYRDAHLAPLFWALAPALPAVAAGAVLRGYFLGMQVMRWPAWAQVAEPVLRVAALAWLLGALGPGQVTDAPTAAAALIPLGECFSLALLALAYWREPRTFPARPHSTPPRGLTAALWRLAWPVTAGRLLGSLVGVAQAALIPRLLQRSGLTEPEAVAYYGQLTGMALPFILFPTALSVALSHNLVPRIAEASGQNRPTEVQRITHQALSATAYWTVPVTTVLVFLGPRLDDLLFHSHIPREVFWPLVVGGMFLYFDVALAGILRGLGRTEVPVRNELVASLAEIAALLWWAPHPGRGTIGVAGAIAVGFVVAFALDLRAVVRLTGVRISWMRLLARPCLAAAPLPLVLALAQSLTHLWHWATAASTLAGLLLAAVCYGATLWVSGLEITQLT